MSFPRRKIIDVVLADRAVQEEGKVFISDIASEYNSTMMMRLPTIVGEDYRRWLRTVITAPKKKKKEIKRKET